MQGAAVLMCVSSQPANGGPRGSNEVAKIETAGSGTRALDNRTEPVTGAGPRSVGDNAVSGDEAPSRSSGLGQRRRPHIGHLASRSSSGAVAQVTLAIWDKPMADCGVAVVSGAKIATNPSKKTAAATKATRPARTALRRACRPRAHCTIRLDLPLPVHPKPSSD